MLTEEENRTLTQISPGTPMGALLRRYWQPIAALSEFDDFASRPIRLLGEDLVLYRDLGGTFGLIERRCAHRLTDMAYGIPEDYGFRCPLHGWLYNEGGLCLDMPLEPEPYPDEVRITAYPVQERGGVIWAYMGPEPAPLIPDWEPFTWEDGLVQIVFTILNCNWLQCQENAMDPSDVEWLHLSLSRSADHGAPPPPPANLKIDFEEIDHGFLYRRALGQDADNWTVGQTCLWPNGLFAGNNRSCRFEWRVPMDETHTMNVAWFIDRVAPGHELPTDKRFRHWYAEVKEDPAAEYSDFITSHLLNQKYALWLTQEKIVDRTKENLVDATDQGVIMLRNKYFTQIDVVSDGGEPKALLRDPGANRSLPLPFSGPKLTAADAEGTAAPEAPQEFPYIAGQPEEIAELYRAVLATWDQSGEGASTTASARETQDEEPTPGPAKS